MNKQLEKEMKRYINEIRANMVCDFRTKQKFVSDMRHSVYDYAEEQQVCNMDAIYNHFGTPQQIAKGFLETADVKKIKRRMNFTKVVVIGIIIALVMFGAALIFELVDSYSSNHGYMVETIHDEGDYSFLENAEEN